MKKVIDKLRDYLWIIIPAFIMLIFTIIQEFLFSKSLKARFDDIFGSISIFILFVIWIYVIFILIKRKKEKNRLYKKYGYEKINKLKEYINKVSVEEPEKYYENCEWIFNVADSCYDFLEEGEELEYSKNDYEKDLKKLSNLELKEMNIYVKASKEVMDIISEYYNNRGKRKNKEEL